MGLKITGLNELREHLERLRPEEVMAKALAEQAQRVAARVRDGLSEPPGAAGHDEPWLQSGALRDSVGAEADGLQAAVGSSDPAAVPQELGTAHMPARPFLAPVAAGMGEEVARTIGARVAAALRGDSPDGFDPSGVQLISGSGEHPEDLGDVPPEDRRAVEEGRETPGEARAHGLPQPIPGLNSPVPTIPLLSGRSTVPVAPRPAAPTGQPTARAVPNRTPDWLPPEVRSRVPPGWGEGEATNKGEGWRWTNPENQGNGVRIDRGDANNSQPIQQQDHVIVRSGGRVIGRDGQPIAGPIARNAEQAHIPLSEYQGWTTWNHP